MVVAAAVGARAHGDDPARLGHLVVDLAQGGGHLVGQGARDDHDVRLPRRGAEDDADAVLVVARRREVHHLDGAAGEAEGHGPEGGLPAPVDDLVEGRAGGLLLVSSSDFYITIFSRRLCRHEKEGGEVAYRAYWTIPLVPSWLARGTLSGSLIPVETPWGWSWEASFLDEDDIEAAATRKGMREVVVGLARFEKEYCC